MAGQVLMAIPKPEPEGIDLYSLKDTTCKWPVGKWTGPFETWCFCGKPVLPSVKGVPSVGPTAQPYCDDHRDVSAGQPRGTTAAERARRSRRAGN